jgi:hypothetical protein
MKPDRRFLKQPKTFWANVRTIGEQAGYTIRGEGIIKVPTLAEMVAAMHSVGLEAGHIADAKQRSTKLGRALQDYFALRADVLNNYVEPRLMDANRAKQVFQTLRKKLDSTCPIPMNKQKKEKKQPAYLTAIVNMLIEAHRDGFSCDYDPRCLTTVTKGGSPLRTLARRVDGAFPSTVNPIAVWEIKEYYYTTTFGSRVADGVYESLLDGMELEELLEHENIHVRHYLIVDAHYTWWECGKSYLCRLVDMLHMGYVDEILFGLEVVDRLPEIVAEWVAEAQRRKIVRE